jgi:hypothetical protein
MACEYTYSCKMTVLCVPVTHRLVAHSIAPKTYPHSLDHRHNIMLPGHAISRTRFTLLFWIGGTHALPTPQQQVDAGTTEGTLGASASATTMTGSTSGISNAELIGYAAAGQSIRLAINVADADQCSDPLCSLGIAALLAIAVGGIIWNKRRKRKTAVAAESEPPQGNSPRKESFDSSVDEKPHKASHEPVTPVGGQNLAGRGVQANGGMLKHQSVPAKVVRKYKRDANVEYSSEEEQPTQRPRQERRSRKKSDDRKHRRQSESSDSETESCTDESVRSKQR